MLTLSWCFSKEIGLCVSAAQACYHWGSVVLLVMGSSAFLSTLPHIVEGCKQRKYTRTNGSNESTWLFTFPRSSWGLAGCGGAGRGAEATVSCGRCWGYCSVPPEEELDPSAWCESPESLPKGDWCAPSANRTAETGFGNLVISQRAEHTHGQTHAS